jgi:hypothetical protein
MPNFMNALVPALLQCCAAKLHNIPATHPANRLMLTFLLLMSAVTGMLIANQANAEQSMDFGDYTVHFIAVNSTFLDADIARQYGITRGERQAFLNISVLRKLNDDKTEAVRATLSGQKRNLLGQRESIRFMEVNEGQSIYYIGPFEFTNAEQVRFEVEIQVDGETTSQTLSWETRMYIN